ncbi:MAG TPA: alpha-amylase/4-alpha-glucanotransferase domain-containing protein [Terriglobia bacterium]|nr:alpha-amylase/4-alpha-glucanotransferase domain-containing protein [Terriglobia bacterium]
MGRVSLALIIHSHQPVGNFDHVIEEAYQKSYAPFVRALLAHPQIRLSLHFSGILLEWLENHHPEYFQQLRDLTGRGQMELVGGGYYEPILPMIPDADKVAQVRKMADYIAAKFGTTPRGAWVAERVWEPTLPGPLAQAGVEYTVLDDTHFLAAGLQPWQLHGTFMTEEDGNPLRLVPSSKALRYAIPFQEPAETLRILREGNSGHESLIAMGDDCEKFGVWPGTYNHVYKNGWLERFFRALEGSSDWLETTTVTDYLKSHAAVGRIYLPTASYAEMMEWSLPPKASAEFKACLEESEHMPNGGRFLPFLRGGLWRNFLTKYPESNRIQKQMVGLSHRLQRLGGTAESGTERASLLEEARLHLLAAQCNDPYWHGVFGGLYAPHLRSAILCHMIRAEFQLDCVEGRDTLAQPEVVTKDFDVDGQDEILVRQGIGAMTLHPADGATVSSLRFQPAGVELVNSIMRRPEAYHDLVRKQVSTKQAPREGPASIHDQVLSKESHLEGLLRYDRYARHCFRTFVFPSTKNWQDFELLRLEENEALARGAWKPNPLKGPAAAVEFRNAAEVRCGGCTMRVDALKTLSSKVTDLTWQMECRTTLDTDRACPAGMALGLELVLNLLAPDAHDRYFLAKDVHRPLEFRGEIVSPTLMVVDEWQKVMITLQARPQVTWWIVPIETISQSELGFERVYQGSAILAVWKIEPPSWRNATCTLQMEIAPWDPNNRRRGGGDRRM